MQQQERPERGVLYLCRPFRARAAQHPGAGAFGRRHISLPEQRYGVAGTKGDCSMKSIYSAVVAVGISLGVSLAAPPAYAADSRNVSVVNETGYAIKFLGFNAPDDGIDEWENELEGTLKNQASTYVEFDEDDEGCVWNIKVDWANYDESVLWKNVNLCKFNVLRLRYDSGTKTTSFLAE
jgi:hypothetical protein